MSSASRRRTVSFAGSGAAAAPNAPSTPEALDLPAVSASDVESALTKLAREETDIRGKLITTWTSASNQLVTAVLLPMANGAIKGLLRDCANARRDASDATEALAERDAELSGLLLHQQSESLARAELTRKCEVLEKRAREAEQAVAAGQQTLATTRDELRALERLMVDIRERNATLEATSANRKDEAVAAVEKLDSLRSENRELKARILQLENDAFSHSTMLNETRSRLRHAEATVKELRDRNSTLIDELDAISRDMGGEGSRPAHAGSSNSGSPNAAAVAVATVRERLDAVIESKNTEIAALTTARAIDAERISHLESSLKLALDQHRNATSLAATSRDSLDSIETLLRGSQAEVRALEHDKQRMLDQISNLTSQCRESNRLIEELTQNNKNLQREAAMWERRVREGETEGNRNEGRIVQLTTEIEARSRLVAHLESQCDALTSELQTTQRQLAIASEALKETTEIIDPMREELHKNSRLIAALKEKFRLNAERHNPTVHVDDAASGLATPRTGHYRDHGANAAANELSTFMEAPSGSIVERLQDVIFAKTEEIKRLSHSKTTLLKQLQDAEVTIERMARDSKEKNEEFRRSLSQALNTFTGIGGYDSLVDGVFRAKEMHFKVASLATQLEHEQQRYEKLLVRCRVLERHLEEHGNHTNRVDEYAAPKGPSSNEFAARLDAILADGSDHTGAAEGRVSTGSNILTLDNHEADASPTQTAKEPIREGRISANATRGLLFRAPSPSASNYAATSRLTTSYNGDGKDSNSKDARNKSDRIVALEAKMAHVDSLRRQLLDLEKAAADSSSGVSRQRLFTEMDRLHNVALGTMSGDTSRQSTPRHRASSGASNTPSSKPITPRSNPLPMPRLEEHRSTGKTTTTSLASSIAPRTRR